MKAAKREKAPTAESLFLEAERFEESGDFKKAFKCLLVSAQLGDTSSQINLGNFYSDGKGIRRNPGEAARWYKKACRNGERIGALNLAIDRRNEGKSRSAVIWFKKAIAMNDGEACVELAKMYKARNGTKEAAELLRRALLMSRNDISDYTKEEAASLLKEFAIKTHVGVGR